MSETFIRKNVKLHTEFDGYLANHPNLFSAIPNGAYIVVTVKDDEKFNEQSRSLIKDKRRKKIVEAYKSAAGWEVRPLQAA